MKKMTLRSEAMAAHRGEIEAFQDRATAHHRWLHEKSADATKMTGWVDLPVNLDRALFAELIAAGEEIRRRYSALVVVGIGGSYLGTRACYEMLASKLKGVRLFFAGWNLSGRFHADLLRELDAYDVAVCVVSKSGTTIETTLCFEVLKDYLRRRYGEAYPRRIYAVTDGAKGALRWETETMGYHGFALEENIGGRYSVLTAVGLLPLAAAGADVTAMLAGAALAYDDLNEAAMEKNPAYRYAAFRNLMFQKGKVVEFFSFTEPEMIRFGDWLKQLFAESEGKAGKGIYPTYIGYSTDLHSVGQFLEEGNPIFCETMITVAGRGDDAELSACQREYSRHCDAIVDAVYHVRNRRGTPMTHLALSALDEENIGYLIYFFEKACAMSCLFMGVDPFDQPGVEAYKKELHALLQEDER